MTDLLAEYRKHREQGHGHRAALKALARRFDLDPATVGRVIVRAERAAAPPGGSRDTAETGSYTRRSRPRAPSSERHTVGTGDAT